MGCFPSLKHLRSSITGYHTDGGRGEETPVLFGGGPGKDGRGAVGAAGPGAVEPGAVGPGVVGPGAEGVGAVGPLGAEGAGAVGPGAVGPEPGVVAGGGISLRRFILVSKEDPTKRGAPVVLRTTSPVTFMGAPA